MKRHPLAQLREAFPIRMESVWPVLIPLAVGSIMLFLSWQKWADVMVDFGRELYIPWRLNNGSVLYRDIAYFFGPLPPYLNAFIFKIFGVHLMSIAMFNIVLIIILSFIIYSFFNKTTNKITATAATTIFLGMFAFSQYMDVGNYNFVCPYSQGMTHGIILSFLTLYAFLAYLKKRQKKLIFLIGLLLGLIFLTKPEIFLAIFAAMFLGIFTKFILEKAAIDQMVKESALIFTGFILPVLASVIYFSGYMPLTRAFASITDPYLYIFNKSIISNRYYQRVTGTDHLAENIIQLLISAAGYLAVILSLGLINYGMFKSSQSGSPKFKIFKILGLLFFFSVCIAVCLPQTKIFMAIPLLMLILAGYFFVSLLRSHGVTKEINRLLPLFIMAAFAFFLILKIVLNAHIFHYGFVLALPAVLMLVAAFTYEFPELLAKRYGKTFYICFLSLLLIGTVLIKYMVVSARIYSYKTYPIGHGLDRILDFNPDVAERGVPVGLALKEIDRIVKKGENFVVFPEGVMLNYLARRINPIPYVSLTPLEIGMLGEDSILDSFEKAKPDYIVLANKNMAEFGYAYPRKTFATKILNWIDKNYLPIAQFGKEPLTGSGFGIVIAKRIKK